MRSLIADSIDSSSFENFPDEIYMMNEREKGFVVFPSILIYTIDFFFLRFFVEAVVVIPSLPKKQKRPFIYL